MKTLLALLILLAAVPALAAGKGAAPYTEEALQKINQATNETPMTGPGEGALREDFHRYRVEYFTEVFAKAGYSFPATIDQVVADMKNNPKAIPADRETVYNRIYMLLNIMMAECGADQVDCLPFYPEKTRASIPWFIENSGFIASDH